MLRRQFVRFDGVLTLMDWGSQTCRLRLARRVLGQARPDGYDMT